MTQPQPIVHSAFQDDLSMTYSSSLNNPNGPFNPASYTRAFFGSPFSWRPGSFGNRSVPGSSPTQLLGPLEYVHFFSSSLLLLIHLSLSPSDLRGAGKISSSVESDRGSLIHALSAMEREDELVSLVLTLPRSLVAKQSPLVPQLHLLRYQPPGPSCSR
jgi:transcription factor SFP1